MGINVHGFELKQQVKIGGVDFTIIKVGTNWVEGITTECVGARAFDSSNHNDFAASDIRAWMNGEFLHSLIDAGVPEGLFKQYEVNLITDDGTGFNDCVYLCQCQTKVGLITCDEYREVRHNIPKVFESWWTATADSPQTPFVKYVNIDGYLRNGDISNKSCMNGVRPVCMFDTEVLREHICCFDEIRVKMEELSKAITKSTAEMGTALDELYRLLQKIHRDKDDYVALYPLRGENKSCRKEQTCL